MSAPGYFNAHCHLELGFLRGVVPPGLPFVDWLQHIVAHKRMVTTEVSAESVRAGIAELRAGGTTAIADILAMDTADAALEEATDLRRVLFREVIRFDPAAAEEVLAQVPARRTAQEGDGLRHGLSPHAPYTITEPLLRGAVRDAQARGEWLCIHAAETPEETEMLLHGRGRLHEFLRERVLPPDWTAPGLRPVQWLDALRALGPRTLLVHCNDVDGEDIPLLARSGTSVVLCPGTHVFFARGAFPLRRLLDAGVRCFLGTDSLASNERLDMTREVELAMELTPGVRREIIEDLASAARAECFFQR